MSAAIKPFVINGRTIRPSDEPPHEQARAILHACGPGVVREKLLAAWAGVLGAAALDLGLMVHAQREAFLDAMGNFTGSPVALAAMSCLSLAVFWLIGMAWDSGRLAGRIGAGCLYAALWLLLYGRLAPAYGDVFSGLMPQGNAFMPDGGASVPPLLSWFGIGIVAGLYSIGGVLFILAKRALGKAYALRRIMRECQSRLDLAERCARQEETAQGLALAVAHLDNPANGAALLRQALHAATDAAHAALTARKDAAEAVANNLLASKDQQTGARKTLAELDDFARALGAISLCVLASVSVRPAHAATTQELLAKAPTMQIYQDLSGGSPGTRAEFLRAAWPEIAGRLRALPLGSLVAVHGFGDASLPPVSFSARIQARKTADGDTADNLARGLQTVMLKLAADSHGNEHTQSEIIGALFDAARGINPLASGNVALLLTDGGENSHFANCIKPGCKLPAPTYALKGASVVMLGVGQGMPSDQAQQVARAWDAYLTQTGAAPVMVRRE